jgi:hypothetical protein
MATAVIASTLGWSLDFFDLLILDASGGLFYLDARPSERMDDVCT